MTAALSVLPGSADRSTFERLLQHADFAEIETHPQTGAYARAYYPAVHGDDHRDLSFVVRSGDVPLVIGLCSLIDGVIGLHGLPMQFFGRKGISPEVYRGAVKAAFFHLDELAASHGA
jgi:hypothetical protein